MSALFNQIKYDTRDFSSNAETTYLFIAYLNISSRILCSSQCHPSDDNMCISWNFFASINLAEWSSTSCAF